MIYMIKTIPSGIELFQNDIQDIQYVVEDIKAITFINEWCILNGSTYEGRRKAFATCLHIQQKVPILVSEKSKDILIPTHKVTSKECIWLNFRGIDSFKCKGKNTLITFLNGEEFLLSVGYRTLKREFNLCYQILEIIKSFPV